jgi:4-hydroxybenzoate polyprenyltransferase
MQSNTISDTIRRYFQLITFSHTIFALPFSIIGFTLGIWQVTKEIGIESVPVLKLFFLVMVCMVTARSAAMAFNRYLDRNFDASNPRTALREIPAGIIAASSALRFVVINAIIFTIAAASINPLCGWLSPVALFVILFYSYTKRFTPLCHVVLGIGLSLAPIGAYLSITGAFSLLPVLFSLAVVGWVSGFDIIYSLQDEEFDREHQLNSIPVWLGKRRALQVAVGLHITCAIFLAAAGMSGPFGYLYWLAYALFVAMLIYQHSLVKPTDLSRVNRAFMTANGIASVIFGILVVIDIIRQL